MDTTSNVIVSPEYHLYLKRTRLGNQPPKMIREARTQISLMARMRMHGEEAGSRSLLSHPGLISGVGVGVAKRSVEILRQVRDFQMVAPFQQCRAPCQRA